MHLLAVSIYILCIIGTVNTFTMDLTRTSTAHSYSTEPTTGTFKTFTMDLTRTSTATSYSSEPTTEEIYCGSVPAIADGTLELESWDATTSGSKAYVICSDGFDASKSFIYCQSNGQWETAACERKDCGDLPDIDKGVLKHNPNRTTIFGSNASVHCNAGYSPGKEVTTCLADGSWEDVQCAKTDCGPFPVVANGSIAALNTSSTLYGSTAVVVCDVGFISNHDVIVCQETGLWENPFCFKGGSVILVPNLLMLFTVMACMLLSSVP